MVPKLRQRSALIPILVVFLLAGLAVGQVLKGSISGTATDPQGAVLAGAEIKATNLATGSTLTAKSDSSGLFRFNLIPAGEYKVQVSAQGFNTAVQNNIVVAAGRDTGLGTIKLAVGQTSTTVEVTAAAPLIESTQSQVTNTFAGTQLSSFAGVQENEGLDNLALFVPGVSSSRDNNFSNTNGGGGFSSNGLRGRNNDQQIDGQNNNDNSVAGPALFVTDQEFVNQYVIVTNQFGPEYGRNSGSVVNVITKSGGNAWHGSIFGNENNSILNSMTNFQKRFDTDQLGNPLTKPPRLNDEFAGFTIGGPWVKNKLFFFGGFDEEIVSQKSVFTSNNLTPTPTGLATLAACPGIDSSALSAISKFGPFGISGGNPVALTDPISHQFTTQDITTTDPVTGNTTVVCPAVQFGGVGRTLSAPSHIFDWIGRTDFQLGSDTITARYLFNRNNTFNSEDNGAAGYVLNVPALSQAILLSWTHNLSAQMVNEARVSFGRTNVEFGGNTIGNTEPTAQSLDQAVANVTFSAPGLLGFGPATNLPQQRIVNTWQGQDNWNYVLGKHQLKAGVNYTFQRSPNIFLPNINGQFRFTDWNAFLLNTPNRVRIANGPSALDFREHDTFLYVGDDWKMSQSLTWNLGLTWSYYGQPANIFNDITTTRESNPATAFWDPSLPLSVRTFPTIPAPKKSFGPSVGFAWSPQSGGFLTGNGKTVIRGGYRLLYDPPFYNIYLNMATSAPEVFLQTFSGTSAAAFPIPAVPTGPNVRTELTPALTHGVLDPRTQAETTVTPNFGPDKVHTWSLGIERELTKNSAVEARYVGNRASNLFQTTDGNPFLGDPTGVAQTGLAQFFPNLVPPGLTPCTTPQISPAPGVAPGPGSPDLGRANCGQGVVRVRSNTGYSHYHALQTEFRANNLAKQLTLRASYTFSKTLDNVSEIFSTFGAGNSVAFSQNPVNFKNGEYSFSGLDYPHQFSILFTEQLPFMKEQHGLLGHLLGGWSVSANYIAASGQRYTPSQLFTALATSPFFNTSSFPDFFDLPFVANFNGVDSARPFFANKNAPITQVGIFAADACNAFGSGPGGPEPVCALPATQLVSMNAINSGNAGLFDTNGNPVPAVTVTNNDVRFILNGGTAEQVFGTPFGNVPRNIQQDAITNVGNFSVFKSIKLGEKVAFEFHATSLNAFNHPNFQSIDPFLEDAGITPSPLTGFGDPTVSNTQARKWIFGGRISF